MPTRLRYWDVEANGGQRVLQGSTLTHVHVNVTAGNQRQTELTANDPESGQTFAVGSIAQQLHRDPDFSGKAAGEPAGRLRLEVPDGRQLQGRQPEDEALLQADVGHVRAAQRIASLGGCPSPAGNEAAQLAVPLAIDGQRHETQAALETEFGPDDQLQRLLFRRYMGPYDTSDRTLIGDGERLVTERDRPLHELLRMRSAAQESKVGDAMQLSIGSRRGHTVSGALGLQGCRRGGGLLEHGVAAHDGSWPSGYLCSVTGTVPVPRQRTPSRLSQRDGETRRQRRDPMVLGMEWAFIQTLHVRTIDAESGAHGRPTSARRECSRPRSNPLRLLLRPTSRFRCALDRLAGATPHGDAATRRVPTSVVARAAATLGDDGMATAWRCA